MSLLFGSMSDKISDEEIRRIQATRMTREDKIEVFLQSYFDTYLERIAKDFPNVPENMLGEMFKPDFVSAISSYLALKSAEKLAVQNLKLTEQNLELA